ncbi:hypothetical protein V2A60_008876 [Cordyceps javanica]
MPRAEAAKRFDIPSKELKRLPAARSLPGRYLVMYGIKRSRPQRLVSVRAAKQLAMKVHGGTEASLAAGLRSRPAPRLEGTKWWFAHLQRAQLEFEDHDTRRVFDPDNSTNDMCNGMVSILFPAMRRPGNVEDCGSWCRGCNWVARGLCKLDREVVARLVPNPHDPDTHCRHEALREWSDKEFAAHAKSCHGLQNLAEPGASKSRDAAAI